MGAGGAGRPDPGGARGPAAARAAGLDSFDRYGSFGAEVGALQDEL
ncbi:methyltransferase, partial [Frankia sp. AgW1.1]|nr:methyltransferase [Frankia sp. AgW1.1]